jgi:Arc/MetJ-type ribon-helix-helix transcriptional regulator
MKIQSKEIKQKYSTKPVQVRLTEEAIHILTNHVESEGGTIESVSAAVNELIRRSHGRAVQIKTERLHEEDLKKLQSLLSPLLSSLDILERPFTRSYLLASDIDSLTSAERSMRADIIKLRDQTMRVLDQISFERLTLAKLKTADLTVMSESILGLLNCLKSCSNAKEYRESISNIFNFFKDIGLSKLNIENSSILDDQDIDCPRILKDK